MYKLRLLQLLYIASGERVPSLTYALVYISVWISQESLGIRLQTLHSKHSCHIVCSQSYIESFL